MTSDEAINILNHIILVADTSDCGVKEIDGLDEEAIYMGIKALEYYDKVSKYRKKAKRWKNKWLKQQNDNNALKQELIEFSNDLYARECGCGEELRGIVDKYIKDKDMVINENGIATTNAVLSYNTKTDPVTVLNSLKQDINKTFADPDKDGWFPVISKPEILEIIDNHIKEYT